MSTKAKECKSTKTVHITVVVIRPTAPNCDVLDNVYQILAASKTA